MANHLIHETSAYLKQHISNPVDWYPWGEEAFEKAKKENKPVFLSVGYSSCHWCHVMEEECFSKEEVAQLLNEYFVCIKVDREERPDIDSIYMIASQLINQGRGGWPNSVWLTPDKKPWFAGTYFPKDKFIDLLFRLNEFWNQKRERVLESAEEISQYIKSVAEKPNAKPIDVKIDFLADLIFQIKTSLRILISKGNRGPKFPPHSIFRFALSERIRSQTLRDKAFELLDQIAVSGTFDHVGGGFHRYSTDGEWKLPHFEKMLYDNAQLAWAYTRAYELSKKTLYKYIAEKTFDYVLKELTALNGGFYSAVDADSEGEEGLFYLWTVKELETVLKDTDNKAFIKRYSVHNKGNFTPETGEENNSQNILYTSDYNVPDEQTKEQLKTLYRHRLSRPKPFVDEKVQVSWNALMSHAFVKGYQVFKEEKYKQAAQKNLSFLLNKCRTKDGLYHSIQDNKLASKGFLSDYAYLTLALIKSGKALNMPVYIQTAKELMVEAIHNFKDEKQGGFYFAPKDSDLIANEKMSFDSQMPSADSTLLTGLLELSEITGNSKWSKQAEDALVFYWPQVDKNPEGSLDMVLSAQMLRDFSQANSKLKLLLKQVKQIGANAYKLHLTGEVSHNWHITANDAKKQWNPLKIFSLGVNSKVLDFQANGTRQLGAGDQKIKVLDEAFELDVTVESTRKEMGIQIDYQPCTEDRCLDKKSKYMLIDLSGE
jgi:uncharacterized protein YyaL (SSP411 family)